MTRGRESGIQEAGDKKRVWKPLINKKTAHVCIQAAFFVVLVNYLLLPKTRSIDINKLIKVV
jgi:hypothetical protein